jgi:hypothetical protein
MSAKNRGTKTIANDAYPTPPWAVHRLLERVGPGVVALPGHDQIWLEPAYGQGLLRASVDRWCIDVQGERHLDWFGVDIAPGDMPPYLSCDCEQADFLTWVPGYTQYDVAITNPPFSLAFEFARKMTQVARHSFLLTRLNILEAGKKSGRLKWLSQNTPDVYVLPDRPCFSHTLRGEGCKQRRCNGVPIAWDAPTPAVIHCSCYGKGIDLPPAGLVVVERTAGTDATGYCWLHWDSSKLPRSNGLITHLAETPKSERVDRVVKL